MTEQIISSPVREKIIESHGEWALRKSAIRIRGGGGVFERTMKGKGYRTALEIGTYRGCSAAEMSQYVDRVITIDLKKGKLEHNEESWDRQAFWNSLDIHNIELYLVADDQEKAHLIRALNFDFAFIDGAHNEKGVALDFSLVKRCGHVLFHDADDNGPERPNAVYEFIQTIPQEELEYMDIFALWTNPTQPWPFSVSK